jgi:hypothetical protein
MKRALLLACLAFSACTIYRGSEWPWPLGSGHDAKAVRPIILMTADGEQVWALDPTLYFDKDGRLPNIIVWNGRTFERGWTQQGNTDKDERLWFEVKK